MTPSAILNTQSASLALPNAPRGTMPGVGFEKHLHQTLNTSGGLASTGSSRDTRGVNPSRPDPKQRDARAPVGEASRRDSRQGDLDRSVTDRSERSDRRPAGQVDRGDRKEPRSNTDASGTGRLGSDTATDRLVASRDSSGNALVEKDRAGGTEGDQLPATHAAEDRSATAEDEAASNPVEVGHAETGVAQAGPIAQPTPVGPLRAVQAAVLRGQAAGDGSTSTSAGGAGGVEADLAALGGLGATVEGENGSNTDSGGVAPEHEAGQVLAPGLPDGSGPAGVNGLAASEQHATSRTHQVRVATPTGAPSTDATSQAVTGVALSDAGDPHGGDPGGTGARGDGDPGRANPGLTLTAADPEHASSSAGPPAASPTVQPGGLSVAGPLSAVINPVGAEAGGAAPSGVSQGQVALPQGDSPATDANTARVIRGMHGVLNQNGGAVTLRLSPPEMGIVRIQMQIEGGTVNAQLHTEHESARALLSNQINQLRQALESQGLSVDKLQVQTMQQDNAGFTAQRDTEQPSDDGRSRGQYAGRGDGQAGQRGDSPEDAPGRSGEGAGAFDRELNTVA